MSYSCPCVCGTACQQYSHKQMYYACETSVLLDSRQSYFFICKQRFFGTHDTFLRLYAITFELQLLKILSWSVLQKCVFWVYVLCPMKHVSFRNKHVWDRKEDQIIIKFEHIDFKVKVNHLLKIFTEILIYNPWQIRPSLRSQRCRFPKLLSFGRLRTWALALKKATEAEALVFMSRSTPLCNLQFQLDF